MANERIPKLSELPGIITGSPMGLFVAFITLALIFITRGLWSCLFKIFIRLPFNLQTPDKILAGDICNPDKMFKVQLGEGMLNFLQHEWFVWFLIIGGVAIFLYFKFIRNK
ncbi:MAG TPA: hypothetical protein VJC39_05830 [Candidatus Nanoarchaeia archaeon]|nr:hypothetical protein [Candidatus Nanoarchaeia archaeon]